METNTILLHSIEIISPSLEFSYESSTPVAIYSAKQDSK